MASFNKEGSVWCTVCSKNFLSFIAFHNHKISSPKHICCEVCSQDFNNEEAAIQHHKLMHSSEQNLRCPGCNKKFTRLGALIGHIELTVCKSLNLDIETARKEKEAANAAILSARSFKDFSRTGGTYTEEPHPLARTPGHPPQFVAALATAPGPSPAPSAAASIPGYPPQLTDVPVPTAAPTNAPNAAGPRPIFFEGDLLGDFASDDILSAPWGNEAELLNRPIIRASQSTASNNRPQNLLDAQVVSQPSQVQPSNNKPQSTTVAQVASHPSQLPSLASKPQSSTGAQQVNQSGGNVWANPQNLFPDAPPAIAPPPEVAAAVLQDKVNTAPSPAPNPFDPNTPGFRAEKFFIPVLNKFKCPYKKCGKSIEKRNAFIGHLQSPAHRDEKLHCTACLRHFDTATALTQHMESQGVRCKVRETNTYEAVVDQVTGGVALPFGKHQDNTVKYVVNQEVLGRGGGLAAANKAVAVKKNENFNSFWANNAPRW